MRVSAGGTPEAAAVPNVGEIGRSLVVVLGSVATVTGRDPRSRFGSGRDARAAGSGTGVEGG